MPSSLLTSLLAWWGLHDAANANRLDASGNGKTMVLNGSVGSVAGLLGNAASFAGNSTNYLAVGSAVVTAAPFSLSCWANKTALAANGVPFAQSNSPLQARQGFRMRTNGSVDFYAGTVLTSATGLFGAGSWHHLALTYDGATLKGFLDGVLRVSGAATNLITSTDCTVGACFPNSNQTTFDGLVTLAGIWGKVLDDGGVITVGQTAGGEVAVLYNGSLGFDYSWQKNNSPVNLSDTFAPAAAFTGKAGG